MWCRPSEIGQKTTLDDVRGVDAVLARYKLVFYEPEATWDLDPYITSKTLDGKLKVSLLKHVIGAASVQGYVFNRPRAVPMTLLRDRAHGIIDEADYDGMRVTAVTGLAELSSLTPQSTLQQGDSVIRDGKELIIDWVDPKARNKVADYTFVAGDQLASPPAAMRLTAISIGRRIRAYLQDSKMVLDNAGPGMHNRFVDSAREILRDYSPWPWSTI